LKIARKFGAITAPILLPTTAGWDPVRSAKRTIKQKKGAHVLGMMKMKMMKEVDRAATAVIKRRSML
jgi:hypothetical protein